MSIESEILTDLQHLLNEHGVQARWNDHDLVVLISRVKHEQQIDIGGMVESPELSLRVPKMAFQQTLPKLGDRIEVDGIEYRITQISKHPRSPLVTLSLTSTDE